MAAMLRSYTLVPIGSKIASMAISSTLGLACCATVTCTIGAWM